MNLNCGGFLSPPSRRGRRADPANATLPPEIGAAGEVGQPPEQQLHTIPVDMAKRDLNFINIPPLKARRRELRNNSTAAEAILWKYLRRRQLLGKRFRRQYSIGRYIVDFFCVECDLAVELDGAPHFQELRTEYEPERTAFLQALGIELIRFENRIVYQNIEAVLETIREAIRKRSGFDLPGRAES